MLLLISPAKSLDTEISSDWKNYTLPQYLGEAEKLRNILKSFSPMKIGKLMKISDKLAQENYERYQEWQLEHTLKNAKPALFLFQGDVYRGLSAQDFSDDELQFAQNHLRILSGFYGLLRPLDLTQPYRLEMGTKLENSKGKNLYQFWGTTLAENINQVLDNQTKKVVLNLASNEYFKAIGTKNIRHRIITPVFKDFKNGNYKVISVYAKKARGLITRFIIQNRITEPNDLQGFDLESYRFNPDHTKGDTWVFTRN